MPDGEMFEARTADYAASDVLLLGRRTYEVFAGSWPQRGSDVPNSDWMNNTQKFVTSTTLESPEWQNTTVLKGDISEAVSRLKQEDGETVTLNGSATLLRSLLGAGLVDELRILLHPIMLGSGDRLFDNTEDRVALKLTECHAYDNGVVLLALVQIFAGSSLVDGPPGVDVDAVERAWSTRVRYSVRVKPLVTSVRSTCA